MLDLKWGEPKIVKTGKAVMSALPTKKFWFAWKQNKANLKARGISVQSPNQYNNEQWTVNKWIDIEDYYAMTKDVVIAKDLKTVDGLLEYQVGHTSQLVQAVLGNKWALDGSDTGIGKTFVALAVARELRLKPFVICPKAVIVAWWRVAKYMGVELINVLNYEKLKTWNTIYVDADTNGENIQWHLDNKETLMIFDEVHRCKSRTSINARLLIAVKNQGFHGLGLSATMADNPLQMKAIGYALQLFPTLKDYWKWAQIYGVVPGSFGGMEFVGDPTDMLKLHNAIYKNNRGSRISIKSLGDKFPKNQINAETYTMATSKEIQVIYDKMEQELENKKDGKDNIKLEIKKLERQIKKMERGSNAAIEMQNEISRIREKEEVDSEHHLTIMLRARQKVELLKIPTMVELTQDLIAEGNSVVIFVNFEDSLQALKKKLKTNCVIHGAQTGNKGAAIRQKCIDDFQADNERIIICNIKAGGVGISLNDINGNYGRVSLISPTFSAQDLVQALGRIHRAGSKSPARQRIIFAADSIEETICEAVQSKIRNIHALNDGDLTSGLNLGA